MAGKKSVTGTVADPTIQFATLTVDGQEYKLAYSFNAIAEAENVAGCNLLSGLESLGNLSAQQLRGLLYAGLRVGWPSGKDAPALTIEQAGRLIRLDTMDDVTAALAQAYKLSLPPKEADPSEAGAAAAPAEN